MQDADSSTVVRDGRGFRWLGTADLDLLEVLFEPLRDNPFFVKDEQLRYVAANTAMLRLCGLAAKSDLYGRRARDVFQTSSAERYEGLDRSILANGRPFTNHLELTGSQLTTWLLFSRFPVWDRHGRVVGVGATSRQLPAADRNQPTYERLSNVVRNIRLHFDAPLELRALAREAGISVSQLERGFAAIFGTTMQAFLHRTRIEHALLRLQEDASIASIAHECGYSDHSAFTRRFRTVTGLTPKEFRRRLSQSAQGADLHPRGFVL